MSTRSPPGIRRSLPAPCASRLTGWAIGLGVVAYLVFAWWFFAIGSRARQRQLGHRRRLSRRLGVLRDAADHRSRRAISKSLALDPVGEGSPGYPRWSAACRARTTPQSGGSSGNHRRQACAPAAAALQPAARPSPKNRRAPGNRSAIDRIVPGEVTVTRGSETLVADISPDQSVTADAAAAVMGGAETRRSKIIVCVSVSRLASKSKTTRSRSAIASGAGRTSSSTPIRRSGASAPARWSR